MNDCFYFICRIRPVVVKDAIDVVELVFFHGVDLDCNPARTPFWTPGDPPWPYPMRDTGLEIMVNARSFPIELILPVTELVISETVLRDVDNTIFSTCELREVIVRKVIDEVPQDEFYSRRYDTMLQVFQACDEVIPRPPLPKLFEIICPLYMDVYNKELKAKHYHIRHAVDDGNIELALDAPFLEKFPILWASEVILSSRAYEQLKPYLNPRYFAIQRCKL